VASVSPHVKEVPMLDGFMPTSMFILVRFHRWDDILQLSAPDSGLRTTGAMWHFARGMAYAGKGILEKADDEREMFMKAERALPADAMCGFNKSIDVFSVADNLLGGRIAAGRNDKKHAIELLRKAVEAEDSLSYDEPPDWYIPAREALAGVLMSIDNYAEAERVFLADLEKHPRSGRSLFGLSESLKAQKKIAAAENARKEFEAAWKNADTKLTLKDL
jgi:tetratricopeptide (TPR) repeat protein